MSTVGFSNEVRFLDRGMDPLTLDIPYTRQPSSLSSRSRHSCNGATPRSILKTRSNIENWLENRLSNGTNDDVFEVAQTYLPGLDDWIRWRTQLNEAMVDLIEDRHRIFSYPGSIRHLQKHERVLKNLVEPDFLIGRRASDFALQRAVHDYMTGKEGFHLQAPTFISFGLPRVRLRANSTFRPDDTVTGSISTGTLTGSDSPKAISENSSITKVFVESSTESESGQSHIKNLKTSPQVSLNMTVDVTSSGLQTLPHVNTPHVASEHVDTESLCAILDIRDDSDCFGI